MEHDIWTCLSKLNMEKQNVWFTLIKSKNINVKEAELSKFLDETKLHKVEDNFQNRFA